MTKYYRASRKASKRRHMAEEEGEHIPPFLIASITSNCNLHCEGCYSRAINTCVDEVPKNQLDGAAWRAIFNEADDLGIAFIFLAGGEPLLRKDVITEAAKVPHILFPIITNGTLLSIEYINAQGNAEPSPFSPYSDINVKDVGIQGALHSRLFQSLKSEGLLAQEHTGGCALYGKRQQVQALL